MTLKGHSGNIVKAKAEVIGVNVKNTADESLGEIHEIMLDKVSGKAIYAVLDSGSFLGMGGKLFALPWKAISYNDNKDCFILDISKEKLKTAPGFDKNNWPDMADQSFGDSISQYYKETSTIE